MRLASFKEGSQGGLDSCVLNGLSELEWVGGTLGWVGLLILVSQVLLQEPSGASRTMEAEDTLLRCFYKSTHKEPFLSLSGSKGMG